MEVSVVSQSGVMINKWNAYQVSFWIVKSIRQLNVVRIKYIHAVVPQWDCTLM